MTKFYRYNPDTGEYESSFDAELRANGQEVEAYINATKEPVPVLKEKQAAVWNGTAWEIKEDHRQKRGDDGVVIEGSGTAYWLPEDKYGAQARYMTELGALPVGAMLTAPERDPAEKMEEDKKTIRQERDRRIDETQWLVSRHAEQVAGGMTPSLTAEQYQELLIYRQALRDLPQQDGFPWGGDIDVPPFPPRPDFI